MLDGNLAAKRFLQGVRQFTNLFVIQGAGGGDFGGRGSFGGGRGGDRGGGRGGGRGGY